MKTTPLGFRPGFVACCAALGLGLYSIVSCHSRPVDPRAELVERGRELFFNETFEGNARTCGTCHPAENNFTIDPVFIATLPADDPLFVAEFVPALRENFEKPELMRKLGLILENQDGFGDLENDFNLRGVPHTLGLRTSIDSDDGPRTGWSGDGAPEDGSLRSFAAGAVIQHFTRTLRREPGVDFRLPTDEELDALEAFQLSLGRQEDPTLPLPLTGEFAARGQEIFLDPKVGKCNICHVNAGANAQMGGGNANFDTGVEDLPDQPARLTSEFVPPDDGFGTPGDDTFNTPSLVEAADTAPFFHNNVIATLEGAVAFYNSAAFAASPAGQFLANLDPGGVAIQLEPTQVEAVAAFLRVLNAIDNIDQSSALLEEALGGRDARRSVKDLIALSIEETNDAIRVLEGVGLHLDAVAHLERSGALAAKALGSHFWRRRRVREALQELQSARERLVAR